MSAFLLLSEQRAQAIAADLPITWQQVHDVVASWPLPTGRSYGWWTWWFNWGPVSDVAEWVFTRWVDEFEPDGEEERLCA